MTYPLGHVKRFLVLFRSHPEGEVSDTHSVEVYAMSPLEAIRNVRRNLPPMHPWCLVQAWPWPHGCKQVIDAVESLTNIRR